MAQPWKTLETVDTPEGVLELRQRGKGDFLITVGGLVLMNSLAHRSEVALGKIACRHLKNTPEARVLVGGLGMGYTLRAVLDELSPTARVTVAELNPVVHAWCKGPLAELTQSAPLDPRVVVEIADVSELIRRQAREEKTKAFDAIVLDLYKGPHARTDRLNDPLYGSRAIENARAALQPGGVFAIWGEAYDEGFDKRLRSAGFTVTTERPGRGGLRHVVFIARLPASGGKSRP